MNCGSPSSVEVLSVLIRVLDAQQAQEAEQRAVRCARSADAESVLAAITKGENTWERLHAFFPETSWKSLGQSLETLQRTERCYRPESLRFQTGRRK